MCIGGFDWLIFWARFSVRIHCQKPLSCCHTLTFSSPRRFLTHARSSSLCNNREIAPIHTNLSLPHPIHHLHSRLTYSHSLSSTSLRVTPFYFSLFRFCFGLSNSASSEEGSSWLYAKKNYNLVLPCFQYRRFIFCPVLQINVRGPSIRS
jgi:hypothetical protein